jgi:hypothetical protein
MRIWDSFKRFLDSESVREKNAMPPGKRADGGIKQLGCILLLFLLYCAAWGIATHWKVVLAFVLYADERTQLLIDRLISPHAFWELIAVLLILGSLKKLRDVLMGGLVLLTEIRELLRSIEKNVSAASSSLKSMRDVMKGKETQPRENVEIRDLLRRIERQLAGRPR